jgi:hypothetical protein
MRNVSCALGIGLAALVVLGCGGDGGNGGPVDARTQCLRNLRAISQGLAVYAADADGVVPGNWQRSMRIYSKVGPTRAFCPGASVDDGNYGYALNRDLQGQRLDEVESPNTTPFVFDADADALDTQAAYSATTGRHEGVDNVVYVSGRAESVLSTGGRKAKR